MEGYLLFALFFIVFLGIVFGIGTLMFWRYGAKLSHVPIVVAGLQQFALFQLLIVLVALLYPLDLWIIMIGVSTTALLVLRRIGTVKLRALGELLSVRPGRGTALVVIAIMWLGALLRSFGVDGALMPDDKMEPTLNHRSILWVQKNAYGMTLPFTEYQVLPGRPPRRGDVVAFTQQRGSSRISAIGRIIGLPSEQIRLFPSAVAIDGRRIPLQVVAPDEREEDLGTVRHRVRVRPDESAALRRWLYQDIHLEPDQYLLMGDNRSTKDDQLTISIATEQDFVGQVRASGWGQVVR